MTQTVEQRREYHRQYYRAHKEQIYARNRKWTEQHREQVQEYHREWIKNHPDQNRKYQKRSYERHRERFLDRNKKWHVTHRKQHAAEMKAAKVPLNSKCNRCGSNEDLRRHHHDYSKPLEITTLCTTCHWREHHKGGNINSVL